MKPRDQKTETGPASAINPIAEILVNVVIRRIAEERAELRAEKT